MAPVLRTLHVPGPSPDLSVALGILDSGVGGLLVVRHLTELDPGISFCYLADEAHAPYGVRRPGELWHWSREIAGFFRSCGCPVVVLACNSASAASLYRLRMRYRDTRFVGIDPFVRPAPRQSRDDRIGVLATAATLGGEPYAGVIRRFASCLDVYARACPEWVELVENGDLRSAQAMWIVKAGLDPVLASGVDQLVLGCTHFSFLRDLVVHVAGPGVCVIDPSEAVARQAIRVLEQEPGVRLRDRAPAKRLFLTTGPVEELAAHRDLLTEHRMEVREARWMLPAT